MRIVLALLALIGLAVIVLLPRDFMHKGGPSRVAASETVMPRASKVRTSVSRGLRPASSARANAGPRKWASMRWAMEGDSGGSPPSIRLR